MDSIKLIAFEHFGATRLLLRFSDDSWGIYDLAAFIAANTEMTSALKDPAYFQRCFIEMGALAWPNGFDLSAESLQRTLSLVGELHRDAQAA